MKAIVYDQYGMADVLHLEDMEVPQPSENQVLIKVEAANINAGDLHMRNGTPFVARAFAGLFKPRQRILGTTFSGQVAAIGRKVKSFEVGEEVFGSLGNRFGTHAQYLLMPSDGLLVRKPEKISHEAASLLSFGPQTALYFLKKTGMDLAGKRILVLGASGGVGTYVVQLAKANGMLVTGVCRTSMAEHVRAMGADTIIDYTQENVLDREDQYDVIFNTTENYSLGALKKKLNKNGRLICLMLSWSAVIHSILPSSGGKKVIFDVSKVTIEDLNELADMTLSKKVIPLIEASYFIEAFKAAHEHADQSGKKGSIVLKMHKEGL